MRDTTRDRNNLISAWTLLMATSNPNALDVLQKLIPVVQSLLSHVDELQIEIKDLKQKLEEGQQAAARIQKLIDSAIGEAK